MTPAQEFDSGSTVLKNFPAPVDIAASFVVTLVSNRRQLRTNRETLTEFTQSRGWALKATSMISKILSGREVRTAFLVVAAIVGSWVTLRIIAISVAYSPWTGLWAIAMLALLLYSTAGRWVSWLPGLLIFGVMNSLAGLVTQRVPTHPDAPVSIGVASLLVLFYTAGAIAFYYFDPAKLSSIDRCAVLVYLACIVIPAVFAPNDLSAVNPVLLWSMIVGAAAPAVALFVRRVYRPSIRRKRFRGRSGDVDRGTG